MGGEGGEGGGLGEGVEVVAEDEVEGEEGVVLGDVSVWDVKGCL